MKSCIETLGLEVVQAPAVDEDFGFRSVFVRGPDKVLVELVEAAPLATE
jgi:hypothetical protein